MLLRDIAPSDSEASCSSMDEAEGQSPRRARRKRSKERRRRERSLDSSNSSVGSSVHPDLPQVKPRSAQGLTRDAIIHGEPILPSFLSVEVRALLRALLSKDPSLRPSASSVKRHTPWQIGADASGIAARPPWLSLSPQFGGLENPTGGPALDAGSLSAAKGAVEAPPQLDLPQPSSIEQRF